MYNNYYTTMPSELHRILTGLGLSPAEQTVYTTLLNGANGARDIATQTDMKRPTIYYALKQLEQYGLVSKTLTNESSRYVLEPIEKLQALVDHQKQQVGTLERDTRDFIQSHSFVSEPAQKEVVTQYETLAAVRQAILYTLYSKEKCIRSIVPKENFFENASADFKKQYVLEKKTRHIHTKALWEYTPSKSMLDEYYQTLEVKPLPKDMMRKFATTVFLFDSNVLYVYPSVKTPRATLIRSKEHSDLLLAMFETIWNSK